MTWPTSVIIDTVFIPLYVLTLGANLRNVVHHGRSRSASFVSLLLVSLLHLVGNVLLVVEYNQHNASIQVASWGYTLQSVGLSFVVSACLAFYSRAHTELHGQEPLTARIVRLGNLVNLAALICVITGYTSASFTDAQGHALDKVHLPAQAKVGAALYVVLVVAVLALVLFGLRGARGRTEAATVKFALLVATPLMLVRAAWSIYTVQAGSIVKPNNIWAKLVLQFITEFVALSVLTALGLLISKAKPAFDIEHVESYTPTKTVSQPFNAPQSLADQQHQQQQPFSYPPHHK